MAQETRCTCGAIRFAGAKHQGDCILATEEEASPAPAQTNGRRKLEDPGPDSFGGRVRFIEGGYPPKIDTYTEEGAVGDILAGSLVCRFNGLRPVESQFGEGKVADIDIISPDPDLHELKASFFCQSQLVRYLRQAEPGEYMEIRRIANKKTGKNTAHQFRVEIWDESLALAHANGS